ncbi:GNAT family N-acetyltransferase [Protaetiibacter mangrovi]|uniref:GNAT family N-acetyltransferase n=1 Tax=Protaetiibacter mangrovi TaxID=2970926 RepID=A0ABT1ZFX5_9MICO|nr:GNAT family N-acetyltransferase [Protaetiibacter mangrovi]MCS0499611.1 GNAT family N-acetyltransferase [Protaetiibacter mangrovi]TPX03584.1 GNAT family N-acetyltransferase [Schumannella luteola]
MNPAIRPYRSDDLARLREICVLTGAAGSDATGRWSTDELLPDLFLEPYVTAAPDWSWVVDEGDGPIGYLVAVPATEQFIRWWRLKWTPWFSEQYSRPDEPYSAEEELVQRGYDPSVLRIAELEEYPAHFHIDLLPGYQGRGHGRALIENTLIPSLARAGVPGVHLTMDPANTAARAFYAAVGFEDLPSSTPDSPVLGRWIPPRP